MTVEFKEWPKISRWNKQTWLITEKIDGTNACVIVPENKDEPLACQSRNRLLTVEDDNFGFAAWVAANSEQLRRLGPGYHYGEWAGPGIQGNNYALKEKTFFLFLPLQRTPENPLPECVKTVPELEIITGDVNNAINFCMSLLRDKGSRVTEGCMNAEGIVIYNYQTKTYFKKTFKNEEGKNVTN